MPDDDDVVVDDQSPVQKLKKLLEKQKQLEEQQKELKEQGDALKAQIDVLKPTVTELENAGTAFGSAAASAGQEIAEFKKYFDTKEGMVGGALGPDKEKVKDAIKGVDGEIEKAKGEVNTASAEVSAMEAAYEAAKKVVEDKKKAYQDVKDKPKTLGQAVGPLKDLQVKTEKLDPQKLASMYVYLMEIGTVLDNNPVQSPEDYLKELNHAREELDKANEEALTKKNALDTAKENLVREETEYADAKKSRVVDILEKVEPLNA